MVQCCCSHLEDCDHAMLWICYISKFCDDCCESCYCCSDVCVLVWYQEISKESLAIFGAEIQLFINTFLKHTSWILTNLGGTLQCFGSIRRDSLYVKSLISFSSIPSKGVKPSSSSWKHKIWKFELQSSSKTHSYLLVLCQTVRLVLILLNFPDNFSYLPSLREIDQIGVWQKIRIPIFKMDDVCEIFPEEGNTRRIDQSQQLLILA